MASVWRDRRSAVRLIGPRRRRPSSVGVCQPACASRLPLDGGARPIFARERRGSDRRRALSFEHAYRRAACSCSGTSIEADDAYTGQPQPATSSYLVARGRRPSSGSTASERRDAELAALLHDVGKIGIRNDRLNKPGKLTPEEFEIVKRHTVEGRAHARAASAACSDDRRRDRRARCHERWDGARLPRRPRRARRSRSSPASSAACDAFNATTSDRLYPQASTEVAIEELEAHPRDQFDPTVVDLMDRSVSSAHEEHSVTGRSRALLGDIVRLVQASSSECSLSALVSAQLVAVMKRRRRQEADRRDL